MNNNLIPFVFMLSCPTIVSGQNTQHIYIDCNVEYHYTKSGEIVKSKIHFKINTVDRYLYEYNVDKGQYVKQCEKIEGENRYGVRYGICVINREEFRFTNSSEYPDFKLNDSITIYRSSGKITGDSFMDQGAFSSGTYDENKFTEIYKLRGFCQKGVDMSNSKKLF